MSWLRLDLADGRTDYRPGAEVTGSLSWSLDFADEPAKSVRVRLLWFTRGKGDRESEVVATERVATGSRSGRSDFRLRLPAGPYSVRGKVVSIAWEVEAVLGDGELTERIGIVVSPTGREIALHPDPPA